MKDTDKKLVVITGATRGLGRAMISEFVQRGHTVLGCGRSVNQVEGLRKQIGPPHDFAVVDVSDNDQVAQWAKRVLASHGVPDLLLNNAALINRNARLWDVPADEFSSVIDVNIKGVASTIRHFAPAMVRRGTGIIVNWSSGWGRSTSSDVAPYCASKWAIEGLSQAAAQELPAGMACVALNPGVIDTDMLRSCFGGSAASYPGPAEWARKAVPFLLKISARDNGKPLTAP